jgi:very-short-patch-repair endonuclease
MNIEKTIEIIKNSASKNDVLLKYFGYTNQRVYEILNKLIKKYNIDISHLKKNDRYCMNCNNSILNYGKIFCSKSCAASFNNKKRILSDETKYKISIGLRKNIKLKEIVIRKCEICHNKFQVERTNLGNLSKKKCCSDECTKQMRIKNGKIAMAKTIRDGKHKGWMSRNKLSYPEKFFIDVLNNNNIEYVHNFPVSKKDIGINEPYKFFLDFYIKSKNIDLEIDGRQHEKRLNNDNIRDIALIKNGYVVYRIKWKSINSENGKLYMNNEINKFLSFYNNIE